MNYSVIPVSELINAHVTLPGSKSITNRALIIAALAQGESILNNVLFSDDTQACMAALKTLGVIIEYDEKKRQCRIEGTGGQFPVREAKIWCQDSGTIARFLLAACAGMSEGQYYFSGTSQLQSRPMAPLIDALKAQGAEIYPEKTQHLPLTLIKKDKRLNGGDIFISGDESSQFISALLMIAPYTQKSITIKTGTLVSEPYVHLTCHMMKEFGVSVQYSENNIFQIKAPQYYQGKIYHIEPDLSTASYFFAAAVLTNGKMTISPINKETCKQGDIAFLDVLKNMGGVIEYESNAITVHGTTHLRGQTVNMNAISDTMMTLACLAPFADSPTTITGIAHVRYKESDRITAVVHNLKKLGIKTQSGKDFITIFPGIPQSGEIETYQDHRIAMAFSLIGLRVAGIVIKNTECVSKTCPDFFSILTSIHRGASDHVQSLQKGL